ncbi:hypothetical protein GCM10007966_21320 [Legionella impletisoli]|uniref:Uncharacterized protein n=1 Tax=Legionella impletisoli TaxID=343510 RepID=A0A917JZT2_9GAMM|nr:hypothetical protein GCM10007966_21320 [Legionella impletisoli]
MEFNRVCWAFQPSLGLLETLAKLRDKGILVEAEFSSKKNEILNEKNETLPQQLNLF